MNRDDRFHINVGARILHTELTVLQNAALPNPTYWGTDSWNGVLQNFETHKIDRSYTDILPSANLMLDVTRRQQGAILGSARRCPSEPVRSGPRLRDEFHSQPGDESVRVRERHRGQS